MYILGFNSTHDASAALIRDGRVLWAVEEERLSRDKHHYGFPARAIRCVLEAEGISMGDVDHVAFYWHPWRGLVPFGLHFLRHLPKSLGYVKTQPGIWRDFIGLPRRFRRELGLRGRFHFVEHHLAHAFSSFAPSGFEESAILSVDGTGEWTTTFLAAGDPSGIRPVARSSYPHSIGKVWEGVTQYLGFRPLSDEGKVMGLAPYGSDRFVEAFRKILRVEDGSRVVVDLDYFRYQLGAPEKYGERFAEFGPPRDPDGELEDHHRDVAFAVQRRTEEVLLELATTLHERTGLDRLCLVGGVALNCVANGHVARHGPFREVFVQPSAGDAGAALGAALATHHRLTGQVPSRAMEHAYLGPEFGDAECEAALRASKLPYRRESDIASATARELAAGQIVGWFQGRMEYGPRALGNRSILADPRDPGMRDHLNLRVKHRETFRPFAPAILAERAGDYFEDARTSPYMLLSFQSREERRDAIPSVVHVDGSARVQTVDGEANPLFRRLIESFERETGVPVVLNTSFNRRGEPVVCSPADAVRSYLAEEMDGLALGPFFTRRSEISGQEDVP